MASVRDTANRRLGGRDLWRPGRHARDSLDDVLGAVRNLPLRYWRRRMFFSGARDETLAGLTGGGFPARLVPGKSHPVFSLEALPDRVGFRVCPCSSAYPRRPGTHRYIRKGCALIPTGHEMDRDSFLVEAFAFNIPPDVAYALRFFGEVPKACIACTGMAPRPSRGPTGQGAP